MPKTRKIRYAIVGLGHIAQEAVLPGFKHARKNSELAAFVSGDKTKLRTLAKRYGVSTLCTYDEYDTLLKSGEIDAVYIALPNDLHKDYTIRAAQAGVHVLCEKPMALTVGDCQEMIEAARRNDVKLMIAYRLHFEKSNLRAIQIAQSGQLGELRYFNSAFSFAVKPGNIRLDETRGGGPLYDIGVYCINAARNIFRDEPTEVFAFAANTGSRHFKGVEETVSAVLRFPDNRLASFTVSFNAAAVTEYRIVGTKGDLCVENGYEYAAEIEQWLTVKEKTRHTKYKVHDQFGPELKYFSECVLKNRQPEPSGVEGLADLRVIESLFESMRTNLPVRLPTLKIARRPSPRQEITRAKVRKRKLVKVEGAAKEAA